MESTTPSFFTHDTFSGVRRPMRSVWMLIIIMFAGTLTALSGNGSTLPLDDHEVFVARTAEEMIARGSVIVPYLNDQPRLKKPPLCYWLVMAVDSLNGSNGKVSEWEARVPSIVAGIALAALTFMLGCILFSPTTGLVGALLIVSSSGYVYYTHSARPELVYAALCTAAMVGFAWADPFLRRAVQTESRVRKEAGRRPTSHDNPLEARSLPPPSHDGGGKGVTAGRDLGDARFAYLGWAFLGLATLAKGPQLPAMIIVGWMLAFIAGGRRRDIVPVMRPIGGLLIMIGVALWWYLALWLMVPSTGDAFERELLKRTFDFNDEPLTRYFDPYYVYRTAGLVLPWVMLYPLAIALPWMREVSHDRAARLLWWVMIVPLIVLHVSLGRRWYYMLPVLAPLGLLMARVALALGEEMIRHGRKAVWGLIWLLPIGGLALAIIIFRGAETGATDPPWWSVAAVSIAAAGAIGLLTLGARTLGRSPAPAVTFASLVGVVFFVGAAFNGSVWNLQRVHRRDFSLAVAATVPKDAALMSWTHNWGIDQYYLHRVIPCFHTEAKLIEAVEAARGGNGEAWVLVNLRDTGDLADKLPHQVALQLDSKEDGVVQLWKISPAENPIHREAGQ